jgi:hypothetical protein
MPILFSKELSQKNPYVRGASARGGGGGLYDGDSAINVERVGNFCANMLFANFGSRFFKAIQK